MSRSGFSRVRLEELVEDGDDSRTRLVWEKNDDSLSSNAGSDTKGPPVACHRSTCSFVQRSRNLRLQFTRKDQRRILRRLLHRPHGQRFLAPSTHALTSTRPLVVENVGSSKRVKQPKRFSYQKTRGGQVPYQPGEADLKNWRDRLKAMREKVSPFVILCKAAL
jgi:hypothetical protein